MFDLNNSSFGRVIVRTHATMADNDSFGHTNNAVEYIDEFQFKDSLAVEAEVPIQECANTQVNSNDWSARRMNRRGGVFTLVNTDPNNDPCAFWYSATFYFDLHLQTPF